MTTNGIFKIILPTCAEPGSCSRISPIVKNFSLFLVPRSSGVCVARFTGLCLTIVVLGPVSIGLRAALYTLPYAIIARSLTSILLLACGRSGPV